MNIKTPVKYSTYFTIAAGTVISAAHQPTDVWGWVQLATASIVAGCVAIRAIETQPGDGNAATVTPTQPATPAK